MAGACSVDGCDRPVRARGWCSLHWQRWRRTGNPEGSTASRRRDSVRHGTRRGYQLGCRCLPCAVAQSRYHKAWRSGNGARRPATVVADHIARLVESGWTKTAITRAARLGNSTVWHITSGLRGSVNGRTAAAILALEPLELTAACEDCGAASLAGGRWCWDHYQQHTRRAAA